MNNAKNKDINKGYHMFRKLSDYYSKIAWDNFGLGEKNREMMKLLDRLDMACYEIEIYLKKNLLTP